MLQKHARYWNAHILGPQFEMQINKSQEKKILLQK